MEENKEEALRILRMTVRDFMRIELLEVDAGGAPLVRFEGRNASGKSSGMGAFAATIGGAKLCPKEPVRRGSPDGTAEVTVDLGEIIVTRRWRSGGSSVLEVRGKEGARVARPQEFLDSLVGPHSFDPLAFARMKPPEQRALLLELAGVDLGALEDRRQAAYDQRRDVNRDADRLAAQLAATRLDPSAPESEVSLDEVLAEQKRAREEAKRHDRAMIDFTSAEREEASCKLHLEKCRLSVAAAEDAFASARDQRAATEAALSALPSAPDLDAADRRVREVVSLNERARAAAARRKLAVELTEKRAESERLTRQLEAVEAEKLRLLKETPFPGGLAVTDDGVELGDMPFAQASTAQKLSASVAVGVAAHPKLRVMRVEEGSLLDAESMRQIRELARQHEAQILLERVTDGDLRVVIEEPEPEVEGNPWAS